MRRAIETTWGVYLAPDDAFTEALVVFLMQMSNVLGGRESSTALEAWLKNLADRIVIVPWADTLGYGVAVVCPGALFHNVPAMIHGSPQAAVMIFQPILDMLQKGFNIVGIFLESTQMPAYANWVRKITRLPVWDSTVVGKCLMAAAPHYDADAAEAVGNGPVLFNTLAFRDCMMGWWDTERWESSAGLGKDGRIVLYDSLNLTQDQVSKLSCVGGRVNNRQAIARRIEDFRPGVFGPERISASCLSVTPCAARTWSGMECLHDATGGCVCGGTCPGGYYCGSEAPIQIKTMSGPGTQMYAYGLRGEKFPG